MSFALNQIRRGDALGNYEISEGMIVVTSALLSVKGYEKDNGGKKL